MDGAEPQHKTRARTRREPSLAGRLAVAVTLAALVAIAGLLMNKHDIEIVDTFDKQVGDWRIALGSPLAHAQRTDITIVLISEETLLDYESRSPIDRALMAELVRALDGMGAKVIALDFVFDRRTRHDAKLLQVLQAARAPVVLGAIDERIDAPADSFAIQKVFLDSARQPYGHTLLERKQGRPVTTDSTVRLVSAPLTGSTAGIGAPPPFSEAIARAAGVDRPVKSRVISWLRPPSASEPLFPTLKVPRHAESSLQPALGGLLPRSWLLFVKDRIVIVGGSMIDRDRHITPLSIFDRTPTHGVFIQAQAVAQILDGNRDIWVWPDWVTLLVTMAVTFTCLLVAQVQGLNPRGSAYGIVGLGLIGIASFVAFSIWRVDFPSIALGTAWIGGGIVGFMSKWLYGKLGV